MLRIVQSFWRIDAYHYVISLFILGNFPYSEFCFSLMTVSPLTMSFPLSGSLFFSGPLSDIFSSFQNFLITLLQFPIHKISLFYLPKIFPTEIPETCQQFQYLSGFYKYFDYMGSLHSGYLSYIQPWTILSTNS